MPVDDRDAVQHTFADFRPELVLHGGAFTAVDLCETEVDAAYAVNAIGTRHVAEAAAAVGAHVVYVSTDYVFDGTGTRPYRESDPPCPTSVYGHVEVGGGARMPPGLDDRAHQLAVRRPRQEHREDRAAPGRGRRGAALRQRSARLAHLHRRPGARHRHPGPRPPARHLPRDQQRGDDLVGSRASGARGGRRRPGAGAARHHGRTARCVPGAPPGLLGARQHGAAPERAPGPARLAGQPGPPRAGRAVGADEREQAPA